MKPRHQGLTALLSKPPSPQVLNGVTRKLPFFVSQTEETAEAPREELRLKHRVLDLRQVLLAAVSGLLVCCRAAKEPPQEAGSSSAGIMVLPCSPQAGQMLHACKSAQAAGDAENLRLRHFAYLSGPYFSSCCHPAPSPTRGPRWRITCGCG